MFSFDGNKAILVEFDFQNVNGIREYPPMDCIIYNGAFYIIRDS